MEYKQEIVEKMLADERYVGALSEKMARVWKTRGTIPNQYFNPKYVEFIKKGLPDKANQVHDPFYNPKFILKVDLTEDEKKLQERLGVVLRTEKLNLTEICKQVGGISLLNFHDAYRPDKHKRVDMRSEHLLAFKKNLAELKLKIRKVIEPLNLKNGRFSEKDVALIDTLFEDKRFVVSPLIKGNELYRGRITARVRNGSKNYDNAEIQHYIDCFALFLVESSI